MTTHAFHDRPAPDACLDGETTPMRRHCAGGTGGCGSTKRDWEQRDGEGQASQRPHWTAVTLFFADGSGLISRWYDDHAEQQGGGRQMSSDAATAEHLRALHELRCAGGCTNWYTNSSLAPGQSPTSSEIDWSGLPEVER